MERVDDELFRVRLRAAHEEVAGEIDAVHLQPGTPRDLHVDDRERQRDAGPTFEHLVEAAVSRILVLVAIARETELVEEVFVERLDAALRRHVAARRRVALDDASRRIAHRIETREIGIRIEARAFDARDDERAGASAVPGAFEASTSAATSSFFTSLP